jgi:hypothetical protein
VRHVWRRAREAIERSGGGVEGRISKGLKGTKTMWNSTLTQINKHGNSVNSIEDGKATKQDRRTTVRAGKTNREAGTLAVDSRQQREAARQLGQGR